MAEEFLKFYLCDEAREKGVVFSPPRRLDAGFDLPCLEGVEIAPGSSSLIRTGVHLAIPENWVGLIRDRSSIGVRGGVVAAGVIDASYRGEVRVFMHNLGKETLRFEKGERVAQCVILRHLSHGEQVETIEALGDTERGSGGFGSTGKK